MKIAIIGSGNMAGGLARLLAAAGHHVSVGSRTPEQVARKIAGANGLPYDEAVRQADVVFLAVPFGDLPSLSARLGDLAGQTVVDLSNPLTPDYMGLTVGFTSSAGEQVQALFPAAKVVKAFNTVFASVLAKAAAGAKSLPTVLIAGNHQDANETVRVLAGSIGFSAAITGPLTNARYLEPAAELQIQLAYGQGHGAEVGFRFGPVA